MFDQTVNGLYFKMEMDNYRQRIGPKDFKQIEGEHPILLGIKPFKDYPREEEFEILRKIGRFLYGDDEEKAFLELGRDAFKFFSQNPLGKTAFNLLGNNPKVVVLNISKVFNLVTKGIEFEIKDLGERSVKMELVDEPAPHSYYEGIIKSGYEYFGVTLQLEKEIKDHHYIFNLVWGEE